MKGLELSRRYFEAFGEPMLREQFPDLLPYLAAGICGSGSECLGYDDDVSRDHDFDPGFCIFLPGEEIVSRKDAFALERAYAKLPSSFEGFERPRLAPVGGARRGVLRTADFLRDRTGTPDGVLTAAEWLTLPEQSLLETVNGAIFFDSFGEITRIREALAYFPEDIRRKKIAGQLLVMAQSGQYNYRRCLQHGEKAAAQLAVYTFVQAAVSVIFALNRRYQPFYKWVFRAMQDLPLLSLNAILLDYLLTSDNEEENAEEKYSVMEGFAADVIDVLAEQSLTKAVCGDLEKHAYSVNDGIADASVRNRHILAGV